MVKKTEWVVVLCLSLALASSLRAGEDAPGENPPANVPELGNARGAGAEEPPVAAPEDRAAEPQPEKKEEKEGEQNEEPAEGKAPEIDAEAYEADGFGIDLKTFYATNSRMPSVLLQRKGIEGLATGVVGRVDEPVNLPRLRRLDGSTNDWSDIPLWEEGGEAIADPGFSVDIKQVHVVNDRYNMYFFMQCIPSVAERFKTQALGGRFGELFFDVDNNRATGSTDAEIETFGYGNGYESRITIDMNVTVDTEGRKKPWVSYRVKLLDREGLQKVLDRIGSSKDAMNPILRQIARRVFLWKDVPLGHEESNQSGSRIAHGDDGVEFLVPMSMLGVVPGSNIRIMLVEEARDFSMEGYGVRYHTMSE